jgi:hypothetical protein
VTIAKRPSEEAGRVCYIADFTPSSSEISENQKLFRMRNAEKGIGRFNETRHARPCAGHPRLRGASRKKDVDGRDKPGHDEKPLACVSKDGRHRGSWFEAREDALLTMRI